MSSAGSPRGVGRRAPLLMVTNPADLSAATSSMLGGSAGPSDSTDLSGTTGDTAVRDRAGEPSLGLVPTMGGLHEGHAALVRAARRGSDVVVVSIFVNPLQFGDPADLERYPRTLEGDLRLAEEAGADVVFAPSVEDMYPGGEPLVRLSAGRMGEVLEGASRPGHFDGMLTVVAKLLHLGMPGVAAQYRAYFGQKDAQQLALIRRMVLDLNVPVRIEGVQTVRDADGLALSSRNRFLSPEERRAALVLSRTLREVSDAAARGEALELAAARARIETEGGLHLDYLEVVDPASFATLAVDDERPAGALAVVAAKVGAVRLIDNTQLTAADERTAPTPRPQPVDEP